MTIACTVQAFYTDSSSPEQVSGHLPEGEAITLAKQVSELFIVAHVEVLRADATIATAKHGMVTFPAAS